MLQSLYYLFGHILDFFYNLTNDYVMGIVLFTIVVKLVLMPLTFSQMRSMSKMKKLQPKMQEIQKKYKNNPQKQNMLIQKLYSENNINPLSGCLPLLVQFPIIIAMFRVIREPVKYVFKTQAAYDLADKGFFWVKSITNPDVIVVNGLTLPYILPCLSAFFTYLQMKMTADAQGGQPDNEMANKMSSSMQFFMPLMMLMWGVSFPAGLVIYWIVSTIFGIIQQYLIGKYEYHMDFKGK